MPVVPPASPLLLHSGDPEIRVPLRAGQPSSIFPTLPSSQQQQVKKKRKSRKSLDSSKDEDDLEDLDDEDEDDGADDDDDDDDSGDSPKRLLRQERLKDISTCRNRNPEDQPSSSRR